MKRTGREMDTRWVSRELNRRDEEIAKLKKQLDEKFEQKRATDTQVEVAEFETEDLPAGARVRFYMGDSDRPDRPYITVHTDGHGGIIVSCHDDNIIVMPMATDTIHIRLAE